MNVRSRPDRHLVLLAPYDAAVWSQILPTLQEVAEVIVVPPGDEPDVASMAAQALRSMPARCNLVGFCLGGHVALEICRQAPDRVSGVALLNTGLAPDSPTHRRLRGDRIAKLRAKASAMESPDDAYIAYAAPWLVSPGVLGTSLVMSRVRDLLARTPVLRSLTQQVAMLDRPDNRHCLASAGASALVICADHDRVCPPHSSEEIWSFAPQAQVRLLKGCGHLSPLEKPVEVAAVLTEWFGAQATPSETPRSVAKTA